MSTREIHQPFVGQFCHLAGLSISPLEMNIDWSRNPKKSPCTA